MTKTLVAVRNVDEETFRKFRAVSVEERKKLGDALTAAMQEWVEKEKTRGKKNVLIMKPVRIGNKTVRWSEEIDEILYGESK